MDALCCLALDLGATARLVGMTLIKEIRTRGPYVLVANHRSSFGISVLVLGKGSRFEVS